MASGYDTYRNIVNFLMPGVGRQPEQRFRPGPAPVAPSAPALYGPMGMNPMGDFTGMTPNPIYLGLPKGSTDPLKGFYDVKPLEQPNPYLTNPQSGATAMGDPNAMTPALSGPMSNPFLMNPQSGAAAMNDPNAMTPAMAPNAGGRGAGGPRAANVPLPPQRPADLGGNQPILYSVDFGDGSPMRSYLSKDGKVPEIPGANVMVDPSYNPDAGMLTKLIRGVF